MTLILLIYNIFINRICQFSMKAIYKKFIKYNNSTINVVYNFSFLSRKLHNHHSYNKLSIFCHTKKFNFNGFCVLLLLVSVCYQKTLLTADLYSCFFTLSSGKQRIYFWFFFIFLFELQIKNSLNKYGCYTIKKLWFTLKVINRILCKVGDLISCIFFLAECILII